MLDRPLHTRREFLALGARTAGLAAATTFAPDFLLRTVAANPWGDPRPWVGNNSGRILVVLQLGGGNDGLNTIIPFDDDAYHRARPNLALHKSVVLPLAGGLGLHPGLQGLRRLVDAGEVAVVQGVGYPNPNRSHFRSMEIWHAGRDPREPFREGWLGRYFDSCCRGQDKPAPTIGVNVGRVMPGAMKGASNLGVSLEEPAAYQWNPSGHTEAIVRAQEEIYRQLNMPKPDADPALDLLQHVGLNANLSSEDVRKSVRAYKTKIAYPPGRLGESLWLIVKMIAGGLDTRVFYAHQTGYDTHNNQEGTHDRLLRELGDNLDAFQKDLAAAGAAERVVTLVFSEFGRRVEENASGGTDHGAAAPVMLIGPRVQAGVTGKHPSLVDLAGGDLKFSTDFRSVYATLLRDWLEAPDRQIMGADFAALPLIKSISPA